MIKQFYFKQFKFALVICLVWFGLVLYIQQLCKDTGCCPEDLPRAMNDGEEWRERVRDIRATSAI